MFKYLGVPITNAGKNTEELHITPKILRSKMLTKDTKHKVHNTIIISRDIEHSGNNNPNEKSIKEDPSK